MFESIQNHLQHWLPYIDSILAAFREYAYLSISFLAAGGYLLAWVLANHLPKLFKKFAEHFKISIQDDTLGLLRFPLFNLTFLASLLLAVHIAGMSDAVTSVAQSIIKSAMIAIVGISIFRIARTALEHVAQNGGRGIIQLKTLPLFTNAVMVFVLIGTSHQIFAVWDVDMTALLASAGIAGLAIGMAAKDMLSDVIAGVLILTDNPYNVGDIVQLEGGSEGQVRGEVTRLGIRSTRILNEYNVEVIVPNSLMSTSIILNESSAQRKMALASMEIKTGSNIEPAHLRRILTEIVLNHPEVLDDQEVEVLILDFDDRVVTFELVFSTLETDWEERIVSAIREEIYKRMHKEGIPFAIPTEHDIAIVKAVEGKQQIAITHFPDTRQETHIKEMPNEPRTLNIKEVPNLFGTAPVKTGDAIRRTADARQVPGQHSRTQNNMTGNNGVATKTVPANTAKTEDLSHD